MKPIDKLKTLFNELGIKFDEIKVKEKQKISIVCYDVNTPGTKREKVFDRTGFYINFDFDENGDFLEMGRYFRCHEAGE